MPQLNPRIPTIRSGSSRSSELQKANAGVERHRALNGCDVLIDDSPAEMAQHGRFAIQRQIDQRWRFGNIRAISQLADATQTYCPTLKRILFGQDA